MPHAVTCLQPCMTMCCFLQNKNSEFSAPLTSFDWNETDLNRLGTSSIDTTCTIWDIEVLCRNHLFKSMQGASLPGMMPR